MRATCGGANWRLHATSGGANWRLRATCGGAPPSLRALRFVVSHPSTIRLWMDGAPQHHRSLFTVRCSLCTVHCPLFPVPCSELGFAVGGKRRRVSSLRHGLAFGHGRDAHPLAELSLCWFFDEVQGKQRHADEDEIADPRVVFAQAEVLEDVGVVDQVPEVEVEQVEALACFADEDQRTRAEEGRKRVGASKAEDNAAEERHEQAVVNDGIGNDGAQGEKTEGRCKSAETERQAQAAGASHDGI